MRAASPQSWRLVGDLGDTGHVKTRVVSTAVALAATAVLAACSPPVSGTPAAAAGATELKSATVPVRVPPLAPAPKYVDVSDTGELAWDRAEPYPTAWAPVPTPGAAIFHSVDGMCTLGPAIRSDDGLYDGWATAGHCNPLGGDRMQSLNSSPEQAELPLAAMSDVEDGDPASDSGAIWTDVAGSALVAGRPVAGVLTASGVEELPPTTPVCFAGSVSGVECGRLMGIDGDGQAQFSVAPQHGDSGAPVFLATPAGSVVLLGILANRWDDAGSPAGFANLLDQVLTRMNATAMVVPAAVRDVAGLPGFSTRVAPVG